MHDSDYDSAFAVFLFFEPHQLSELYRAEHSSQHHILGATDRLGHDL